MLKNSRLVSRIALSITLFASLGLLSSSVSGLSQDEKPLDQGLDPAWVNAFQWRSIGPTNMGGRCIAIAVSEQDSSTYWIASASGGLVKTTNNGTTYEHQFDHETTVSIGHVAVAKTNHDIVWVGTGEANPRNSVSYGDGVYKSVDGGKTWKHMGLDKTFQTGRIAIHPENPDIVYVGSMGRLYGPNEDRGLYKTIDGGENWEKVLFIDDKTGVIDVEIIHNSPDTILVATYERQRDGFDGNDPAKKQGPGSGIHKSTDGGKTWKKITEGLPTVNLGRIGLDVYRADPNIIYAVIESERIMKLSPESGFMGITGENADVGARLTEITEGGAAEAAELKKDDIIIRIDDVNIGSYQELIRALRNHKSGDTITVEFVRNREFMVVEVTLGELEDPDRNVFPGTLGGQPANVQDDQGLDSYQTGGIYRSDDGGDTWNRINSLNPRPMYYSQIRVDPSDNNYIYVCGTSLYKSSDGGKTFTGDGGRGGVHVDHHSMWVDPNDGEHIILGNDGGIYVTYDRMENWDHHNHVAIGQFYHVSVDTNPFYNVYGGLQDNGSWGGPNRTRSGAGPVNSDWFRVGGGDGFVTFADPNDPNQLYFESQNGGMGRINLETGERGFIRPRAPRGTRYRFNWKTPYLLSSHNSKIFYSAGNYVFRSLDRGNGMKAISPEITRTDKGAGSAFGESRINPDVLYVGTTDGSLWVTENGGHEWTNIVYPPEPPEVKEEIAEEETTDKPSGGEAGRRTAMVRQMINRLDANGDGKLQKDEVPARMQEFFLRVDINGDGVIDEIDLAAATPEITEPTTDLVTGEWNATLESEGISPKEAEFKLKLAINDDGSVTGAIESPSFKGTVSKGTFNKETGELDLQFDNEAGSMSVKAKIEGDSMEGTIEVGEGVLKAPFKAKRGKEVSPLLYSKPISFVTDGSLSGNWTAELDSDEIPQEQAEFQMSLKVADDGKITGVVASAMGEIAVSNGKFDKETGKFTIDLSNDEMDISLSGTVEGNSISGTVTVYNDAGEVELPFKAVRAKEEKKQEAEEKTEAPKAPQKPAEQTKPVVEKKPVEVQEATQEKPVEKPAAKTTDAVTGDWAGKFIAEQFEGEFDMSLKLEAEGKVTGTFSSRFSDDEVSSGKFNEATGDITLTFGEGRSIKGKIKEGILTGEMTAGGGNFVVTVEAIRTGKSDDTEEEELEGDKLSDLLPKPMWVSSIEPSRHVAGRVYVTFDGHRSDNDDPWVFVSENYGKTWETLKSNLPRGSTRVIREDIVNPELLYLGTEFGLYVSVNRGEIWNRFHNNLPTVAVHEVAQHPTMGEIVAGTHGRALWVLDVTALRQMTAEARDAAAFLYKPNRAILWRNLPQQGSSGLRKFTGQNPPQGVRIYYSLGKKAQSISLSIEDLSGATIRELTPSADAGLHATQWDLRRSAPQSPGVQGGGRSGGRFGGGGGGRRGPRRGGFAGTGQYKIVLVVDGERMTQDISVISDPDYPQSPFANEQEDQFNEEFQEWMKGIEDGEEQSDIDD